MKRGLLFTIVLAAALVAAWITGPRLARAQYSAPQTTVETAFTYQGRLTDDGNPADGTYDFRFILYDDASGGSAVGSAVTLEDVAVVDGLFTVRLDFGGAAFGGEARWLEVAVRPGSSTGAYTTLTPRQPLTAAPYALYSLSAPWSGLTGVPSGFADGVDDDTTYTAGTGLELSGGAFSLATAYRLPQSCADGQIPAWNAAAGQWECSADADSGGDITAVYTGTGLTGGGESGDVALSLAAPYRLPQACANGQIAEWDASAAVWQCGDDDTGGTNYWSLTGNSGLNASTNFLGTTDPVSLVLAVDGAPGLRLAPGAPPNLLGGDGANAVTGGVGGAVIAGGGDGSAPNRVTDMWGAVGGGLGNQVGNDNPDVGDAPFATVSGGSNNAATSKGASIGGGESNLVTETYGTIAGGYNITVTGKYASVGGGIGNTASGEDSTVGGGIGNTASGAWSAVGGGDYNTASGTDATVGGGDSNTASGWGATVGGGASNLVTATYGTIAGGDNITVTGEYASVGGGVGNTALVTGTVIGGGESNQVAATYGTIAGGYNITVTGKYASVCGGEYNTASGDRSTVGGGNGNIASGDWSTVGGGGWNNIASGDWSTVGGGGYHNVASGRIATVGGGSYNTASGDNTFIGGGLFNQATADFGTIAGGSLISVTGQYATVSGGENNSATALDAAVGGGTTNTASGDRSVVGGGYHNTASANASTVPGGSENTASGAYSFAAGAQASATHQGSFVWSSAEATSSWGDNTFTARAHGGVRFYTASGTGTGVQLAAGGSSWSSISDRNVKENFAPVDQARLLEALAAMPVQTWNLKAQSPDMRHIGPVAQDFNAAFAYLFGEVESPIRINNMDAVGVALVAAQGLYAQNQEQAARIAALEAENAALQKQVDALDTRLTALEQGELSRPRQNGLLPGAGLLTLAGLAFWMGKRKEGAQ